MTFSVSRAAAIAASTLALLAYLALAAVGLIAWRDALNGEPLATAIHVLLFSGLAPLLVALNYWLPGRSARDFLIGVAFAGFFLLVHAVVAANVAHLSRDQGTGFMLIELAAAVGLIVYSRGRSDKRTASST